MAICVVVSGSSLAVSSMAIGSCTDYVLQTAGEFAVNSPVYTVNDVVYLAGLVSAAWAVAFGLRILRGVLV